MAGLDLKNLIGKLNPQCQRALEGAAGLCLSRTNYNVEIEHWLIKLLEQPGNDLHLLLRHFGVDEGRLLADLSKAVDRLKTGNSRSPLLSPEVCLLTKEAWLLSSVDQGLSKVRSAWLLAALVGEESLARRTLSISDEFRRISPEQLARDAATILDRSIETAMTAPDGEPADGQAAPAAAGGSTAGCARSTSSSSRGGCSRSASPSSTAWARSCCGPRPAGGGSSCRARSAGPSTSRRSCTLRTRTPSGP